MMKILVVDDDVLAAEMVCAILEHDNYQGIVAENVVEAFECLQQHLDIKLIISDMNMPLISGIEFFRELKAQQSELPFILLTGDNPATLLEVEPALSHCLAKDFALTETLPELVAEALTSVN